MKLKLSSTDFEKGEITFRVPWDIFQTLEFWPTELEVNIEPLRRAKQPTTNARADICPVCLGSGDLFSANGTSGKSGKPCLSCGGSGKQSPVA